MASVILGACTFTNNTATSEEKVGPANSEYSGFAAVPMFSWFRAIAASRWNSVMPPTRAASGWNASTARPTSRCSSAGAAAGRTDAGAGSPGLGLTMSEQGGARTVQEVTVDKPA